jgi:hypothetical protein
MGNKTMETCVENEITTILAPKKSGNQRSTERTNHGIAITNGTREILIRIGEMKHRGDQ